MDWLAHHAALEQISVAGRCAEAEKGVCMQDGGDAAARGAGAAGGAAGRWHAPLLPAARVRCRHHAGAARDPVQPGLHALACWLILVLTVITASCCQSRELHAGRQPRMLSSMTPASLAKRSWAAAIDRTVLAGTVTSNLIRWPAFQCRLAVQAVAKAGVGCAGDAQKLMRDFGLAMAGCVDLSEQANLRMCGPGSQRTPETWSLCRAPSLPHDLLLALSQD